MFPALFTCNPKFVLWFHTELIKNLILTSRLTIIKITPTLHISFCERKKAILQFAFPIQKGGKRRKNKVELYVREKRSSTGEHMLCYMLKQTK